MGVWPSSKGLGSQNKSADTRGNLQASTHKVVRVPLYGYSNNARPETRVPGAGNNISAECVPLAAPRGGVWWSRDKVYPPDDRVGCGGSVTVVIAWGKRPVPFRTRKLRLTAPMVLQPGGCGRVGHRRTSFDGGPPTGQDRIPGMVGGLSAFNHPPHNTKQRLWHDAGSEGNLLSCPEAFGSSCSCS